MLGQRWKDLPPFRALPADALDSRLTLPVGGSVTVGDDVCLDGVSGVPADRTGAGAGQLADSAVSWLTSEAAMWPLLPLWPLLEDAAVELANVLHELSAGGKVPTSDGAGCRQAVVDTFLMSILGDVRRLVCRAVAGADTDSRAGTGADGSSEAELAASLSDRYAIRAALAAFAGRHRPLVGQVEHVLATHRSAFRVMARRLAADWELVGRLLGNAEPGRLSAVRAVGDLHERGSVMLLEFDSGARLLYKPRSLDLEVRLAHFLGWLDGHEEGLAPKVPPSMDRGEYGWQAFVAWSPSRSESEVGTFYRRAGALLAIAYLFRATDLHHENVICDGDSPVVIDPECFFGSSFHTTADGENEQIGPRAATVLEAGLLPDPVRRDDAQRPLDISALGSVGARRSPMVRRELRRDGSGRLYFAMVPLPVTNATNAPAIHGRTISVQGYENFLIEGFTRTYRRFMSEREHLGVDGGLIHSFGSARVRQILRPTWYYVKILWELGHPEAARCVLKQEEVINTMWPPNAHERPVARAAFGHERQGLLRGCIPTFERTAGGQDLMAGDWALHAGAFPVSGVELARQRLAILSADDLRVQVRLIEAALRVPRVSPDAKASKSYSPVEAEVPDRETLLATAKSIGDALAAQMTTTRGRAWWLVGHELGDGMYAVRPSPVGLYDGLAGITLFAGYLDLVTGVPSGLTAAAESAMRAEAARLLDRGTLPQLARTLHLGAFDGLWGCVYVSACLGMSRGDRGLVEWAAETGERLIPANEHAAAWDLISGTAGVAAVAAELSLRIGGDVFPRAARSALEVTCARLERVLSHEKIPTGPAHGMSGVVLAFARGARLFPLDGYGAAAEVALDAERSQRHGDDRGWDDPILLADAAAQARKSEGWCRGASGIGLTRIALSGPAAHGDHARDTYAADIELAVRLAERRGVGRDHCLCHGALGTLEFLRAAGHEDRYARLFGGVVTTGRRDGWTTGLPDLLPDPGLMTGLAGIGYGILRHLEPDRVPRVLTLELPADIPIDMTRPDGE